MQHHTRRPQPAPGTQGKWESRSASVRKGAAASWAKADKAGFETLVEAACAPEGAHFEGARLS
jgi:hypothetical protein